VAILLGICPVHGDGDGAGARRPPESALLELINAERSGRGLTTLAWEPTLARLARAHAADMKRSGRATHHSSADGAVFSDRLARTDLRVSAMAENVAFDRDVTSAHRGLMASPGHRANILNAGLGAVGIGIVSDGKGSIYVVEDFATLIVRMTDEEAARAIRDAVAGFRSTGGGAVPHDAALSARLSSAVEKLVRSDSVDLDPIVVDGPAWVFSYTSMDPAQLPSNVVRRLPDARGYGAAVSFRRTPSYPFGTYWVVVALTRGG